MLIFSYLVILNRTGSPFPFSKKEIEKTETKIKCATIVHDVLLYCYGANVQG